MNKKMENKKNTKFGYLIKPLPSKRAFEEISEQIKELIFSKKLMPGDRLPTEREMAVQFASGRTAVREALRILEQSGLIAVRQGNEGGIFVKDVDPSIASSALSDTIRHADISFEDLFKVRMTIEHLVADLSIKKITPEEIAVLKKTIQEAHGILKETGKNGIYDRPLLAQSNIDFHVLLARSTKNVLLEIILESVMKASHIFLSQVHPSYEFSIKHVGYHQSMLDAIIKKDRVTTRKIIKAHGEALKSQFIVLF